MSLSLQDTTTGGNAKDSNATKRQKRRRNRTRDLKKEVEEIMSQEESNMDALVPAPITPSTTKQLNGTDEDASAPRSPSVAQKEALAYTPRRSARKSVKPVQEYEDIVTRKIQLRSAGKMVGEKGEDPEEEPHKWTPAKVGRVSQKRGRKSRKTGGGEKAIKPVPSSSDENEITDVGKDMEYVEEQIVEMETTKENEINVPMEKEVLDTTVDKVDEQNDEKTVEKQIVEMEPTKLNVTYEPMEKEVLGMTVDKVDEQNDEKAVDESHREMEHANAPIEAELILNIEDEVECEQNDDQLVDNRDALNNVVNIEPTEENIIKLDEPKQDGFGIYLKTNILDISDMGLRPLGDDVMASVQAVNTEKPNKPNEKDIQIVTINHDTFNDSDCIILNVEDEKANEDDMQPLRFSDDETISSPPRKSPRIVLTTNEGEEKLLNESVPLLSEATPKRHSKTAQRKPTPFKSRTQNRQNNDDEVMADDEETDAQDAVTITVSTLEPKEIVLRSIRKRSWSVCIGGADAENRRKNVTFYSPANQTATFDDLDIRIEQSVKKSNIENKCGAENFVTQRRKRSLSCDEGTMMKKLLKSPGHASSKMRTTPVAKPPRTKLPNFAAIHQKHFEKMENLVDHVNRKAERAKILTNSAVKNQIASAQKSLPSTSRAAAVGEKPKAVKRINLPNKTLNTTLNDKTTKASQSMAANITYKEHNVSRLQIPQIAVLKPMPSTTETTLKENQTLNLPNPRMGIIKPHTINNTVTNKNKLPTPAKNIPIKPIQTRQPLRPAFNLSTALVTNANKPKSSSSNVDTVTIKTKTDMLSTTAITITTTAPPRITFDEKMALRRQRRMDMYKGRGVSNANTTRTTPSTEEKNYSHQIRGVRSNRRFELQMAHRRNMEH